MPQRLSFSLRKLHSLTGLVPVGLFLVLHLWTNTRALQGRDAFLDAHQEAAGSSYYLLIELVGVVLPLAFHGLYGALLAARSGWRRASQHDGRGHSYLLQRISGIVVLVFVVYHFWTLRWPVITGVAHPDDAFSLLCSALSRTGPGGIPWLALGYLVALAAACYHLANGLTGFCFSWGLTSSGRANRAVGGIFALLGLLLFVIGANTVLYFATGSGLVLAPTGPSATLAVSCVDLGDAAVSRARSAGEGDR